VVPAFSTILVRYDSLATDYDRMRDALLRLKPHRGQRPLPRRFVVPVAYGGRLGPDLEGLARLHGLSAEKVVALHAGRDYRIASLGFSPGFPYLEGLPKELVTPRLPTPRTRVPAGSVGIGGRFTGIYPQAAPGGWHIIGRTPCRLFSPRHIPPVPYQVGDVVRFQPISEAEFDRLAAHPPDLRSAPAEEAR
jgi:inhibitor of KinA